jgi:AcrR family transcriptional regulator
MYECGVRRTAEDAAATRAALLEAALFAFAEEGVASATLAGVASRAQLTRGAVYHHFADKSALLMAVLGESWDVIAAPVWAALDGPDALDRPLADRLLAFATAWLDALRDDKRFKALMTVSMQCDSFASDDEKAHGYAAWRDRLVAALTPARAELTAGVEPHAAAAHLLAWLLGTALLADADPDLIPLADATGVAPALRGLLP